MAKTKILTWGLLAGLITLVFLSSCAQPGTTGGQGGGSDWTLIVFLVLIFAIFYFLMIRPQRKRQKDHQKLVQELHKGDKVVTASGIYGVIDSVGEDTFTLKIESGGTIKMARSSIVGKLNT